jgi:hypothetical protein
METLKLQKMGSRGGWDDLNEYGTANLLDQAIAFNLFDAEGKIVGSHRPTAVVTLTMEDAITALQGGAKLTYGSDWNSTIRATPEQSVEVVEIEQPLVACACGHSVPRGEVMSASRGRVCSDCYDEWSN